MTTWDERMTAPAGSGAVPRTLRDMLGQQRASSGHIICCGSYRTDAPDLEVRVGYSPEDLLHSTRVRNASAAHAKVAYLYEAVLAKGGFAELSPD